MKTTSLDPIRLRVLLSGILLLISAAGLGMFVFGYKQLEAHAAAAQQIAAEAEASRSSLEDLTTVQKYLAQHGALVSKADQLVAQSKLYQYQDKIIEDINTYADRAGLSIESITFEDGKAAKSGAVAAATPATTATPAPSGIKSTTATIAIASPLSYSALLKFMNLIEQSLFRMQISRVGIAHADQPSGDNNLSSEVFTVEVYIRS